MAIIHGTESGDLILRNYFSPGVTSDQPGLTGTDPGHSWDVIHGYGGDDVIVFGYESDIAYGGEGDDFIDARRAGHVEDAYHILFGDAGNDLILGSDTRDYLDIDFTGALAQAEGADTLIGGLGDDTYMVENIGDVIVERAGEGDDGVNVYNLTHYVLPRNFESLFMIEETTTAIGNSANNVIFAWVSSTLKGAAGNDVLFATRGDNLLVGGSGEDELYAYDSELEGFHAGADTLRGGSGNDLLAGDEGADCLVGGRGADVFVYYQAADSMAGYRDTIRADHDARAFQGAGAAPGDLIDVSAIDADETVADFQNFVFGGTGAGHISVVDQGTNSLVRGNVDGDPVFELQIVIADGHVRASAYAAADFILSV